jgi:hypothetical protein
VLLQTGRENMKRILSVIAVIILVGSPASLKSEENSVQKKDSLFPQSEYENNFIFPPIIGPLTFRGSTNFEKTNPGLGYATRYDDHITKLDIYIYDMQIEAIPDNVTSEVVVKTFQSAAYEIFALQKRGLYTDLTYSQGQKINLLGKDMLLGTFEFVENKVARYSILMMTVYKKKFFKARLTINKDKDESYEKDTLDILKEVTEKILMKDSIKENVKESETPIT